jgi:3-oxoacyl-[acyl-carrier-protein] synthase-3
MNGREIFKSAVRVMGAAARELLAENGFSEKDVDHVIPHQANARIVESLSQRLDYSIGQVFL